MGKIDKFVIGLFACAAAFGVALVICVASGRPQFAALFGIIAIALFCMAVLFDAKS